MPNEFATVFNPQTGERKKVRVGDPNAFAGGFELETQSPTQQQPQQPQQQTYTDYINQAFDNPEWLDAQKQFGAAQQSHQELAAGGETFYEDTLSDLRTGDPRLNQLQQERAGFQADLYARPFEAREQFSDIFDPVKREALVARSVGNVMGQLSGTQARIENRGGTLEQQADRALKLYEAQLGASETALKSMGEGVDDMREFLMNIANKNWSALQDQIDRQRDREDFDYEQGVKSEYAQILKGTPTYSDLHPNPKDSKIDPVTTVDDFLKLGYQRNVTAEGGYNFFDPQGNSIDVLSASMDSGVPIATLLRGSTAPADVDFLADVTAGIIDQDSLMRLGGVSANFDDDIDYSNMSDEELMAEFNRILNQ